MSDETKMRTTMSDAANRKRKRPLRLVKQTQKEKAQVRNIEDKNCQVN